MKTNRSFSPIINIFLICIQFAVPVKEVSGQSIFDLIGLTECTGNVKSMKTEVSSAVANFGDVDTDELQYRLNSKYSDKGYLTEIIMIQSTTVFQMKYDEKGQLSEFLWEFINNNIDQIPRKKIRYIYDGVGLKTVLYYDFDDYIENNNIQRVANDLIEEGGYKLRFRITYVRNDKGEIQYEDVMELYDIGITMVNPYAEYYDAINQIKEWVIGQFGYIDNPSRGIDDEYSTNPKNFVTEHIGKWSDGSSYNVKYFRYKKNRVYQYDNHGNWVKCTYFINGVPLKIVERQINYH